MRRLLGLAALVLLLLPRVVQAQIAGPNTVDFTSPDHTTVIPAGQLNAGQPALASYQGMLFKVADDPSSGVPVVVGPVISKTLAALQPSTKYRLLFSQLGVAVPVCSTLPCQQYSLLLVAIGPGGSSARGVSAESDPFTAVVPTAPGAPAGPSNVKVGP